MEIDDDEPPAGIPAAGGAAQPAPALQAAQPAGAARPWHGAARLVGGSPSNPPRRGVRQGDWALIATHPAVETRHLIAAPRTGAAPRARLAPFGDIPHAACPMRVP
eukprot:gene7890-1147_t